MILQSLEEFSLDTYIDEDKIRASKMDFGLVTVEFDGLKPVPVEIFKEDIPKGKIKDHNG